MRNVRVTSLFSIVLIAATGIAAEEPASERDSSQPKKVAVAILIFDGVELLDFAGPAEVFIVASQQHPFRVFTVGPSRDPIKTMGGITVTPEYSYENAPKADVLVVPGGNTRGAGTAGVKWIRDSAEEAEIVMSVCFGALLLAEAKLLDGVSATTHNWAIDSLKSAAPKCKVVTDRRFVDSGKIVTTAGVTAGIDGALHVVERIAGKKVADWTSETWMEYKRPTETKD